MKADRIQNQIATLSGLKMVRFYHLFGEDRPLYGILAYYRDELINLCTADSHFPELFDRIAGVYALESRTADILADEDTRHILEKANAFSSDSYENLLSEYEPVPAPMILPKAFFHSYLLPVIKYVITTLYCGNPERSAENTSESFRFDVLQKQWFGKGVLDAHYGSASLHFPYEIQPYFGECYEITVRNILSDGNALHIDITFGYERITVCYHDRFYGYEGCLHFCMTGQKAAVTHELRQKDNVMFTCEKECIQNEDAAPPERILKLTGTVRTDWIAYVLPWEDLLFCSSREDTQYRLLYTDRDPMKISYCMCFCDLTTYGNTPIRFGRYALRLYEREDITELHLLDLDQPRSGLYQEKYAGRFFTTKQ